MSAKVIISIVTLSLPAPNPRWSKCWACPFLLVRVGLYAASPRYAVGFSLLSLTLLCVLAPLREMPLLTPKGHALMIWFKNID
jgi:hypothetical protein